MTMNSLKAKTRLITFLKIKTLEYTNGRVK